MKKLSAQPSYRKLIKIQKKSNFILKRVYILLYLLIFASLLIF